MGNVKKILAVLAAMTMMLGAMNITANAEDSKAETSSAEDVSVSDEAEEKGYVLVVEGVQGGSALMNDGHILAQEIYSKYSGNDNKLKSGDILEMSAYESQAIAGGLIHIEEGGHIKYLGNVTDVYKDSIKELTVTEKTDDTYFKFKDSEGTVYGWKSNVGEVRNLRKNDAFECDIDPKDINVGDVLECAVEEKEYLVRDQPPIKKMEVVLPVSVVSKVTRLTVVGVSKDYVLFSNDAALSNESFAIYSGTDRKLECGDVIETNVESFLETYPMQFDFSDDSYVKYIGTAEEV